MRLSTEIRRAGAGSRGGSCLSLIFALLFFPASANPEKGATAGEAEWQRLSAEGKIELLGILTGGRLDILRRPRFEAYQTEIGEFYRSGGYTLKWVRNSRPTTTARGVIKQLQAADNKGLPAQDYDSPLWAERLAALEQPGRPASESQLLQFDLALTICAMRYILDLHLGRINPLVFHSTLEAGPDIRGPSDFLRKRVLSAEDVAGAFSALEPPFPSYRRLVKAVWRYRQLSGEDDGEPLPASKTVIKPGDSYSGVPRLTRLLRAR